MMFHENDDGLEVPSLGNRAIRWVGLCILFIFLSAALTPVVYAETVTDGNVAEKIVAAKTVADQQAIAAYFKAKAADAAENVQAHEQMASAYKRTGKFPESSIWMRSHCRNLIRASREAQEEYESLAALHTGIAEGMSQSQ